MENKCNHKLLRNTNFILIPWFTTKKLNNITFVSENACIDERTVNSAAISAIIVPQSTDKQDFFKNGNI